jgi:anti-repressor protein
LSSTEISIFRREGLDIRTLTMDNEPWFVAADVARALDIDNPRPSLALLEDDERGVNTIDTPGGKQSVTMISESGLYSLVLRSRKPEAREFKRWITREVIPAIRKTGTYSVTRAVPQDFASALREFAAEIELHEATRQELAIAQPRAEAWDALASAEGDYSVGDAAKILARAGIPTGPQRLFDQLGEIKWAYRGEAGKWRAYAERVDKGYLAERPQFHYHPRTKERVVDPPQLRVTVKGLERLRQRLHIGALQAVSAS